MCRGFAPVAAAFVGRNWMDNDLELHAYLLFVVARRDAQVSADVFYGVVGHAGSPEAGFGFLCSRVNAAPVIPVAVEHVGEDGVSLLLKERCVVGQRQPFVELLLDLERPPC